MKERQHFRPFVLFFLLLIASLLLTSTLATAQIAYSGEAPGAADKPLDETTEDGQWLEIGSGSASGEGISNNRGSSLSPSLAIGSKGNSIVAWEDDSYSNGNDEIYVRRWDGTSWVEMGSGSASAGGISDNSGGSGSPSLAISPDDTPVVAWADYSSGNWEIYVRRWDGFSWVEMSSGSASGGGISNNSGGSGSPSLAIGPDGNPIVAWSDDTGGNSEIYVRRWDGTSWVEIGSGSVSDGGISDDDGSSGSPSLAINPDSNPIIAWVNYTRGDEEIYVRRWNGTTWAEMGIGSASGGGISNNSEDSESPSLAISPDGTPIIAWEDYSSGKMEIYVRRWDGKYWAEMGAGSASGGGISNNGEYSYDPSLAIDSDGTPMIAWHDWSNSTSLIENSEIYVRYWSGASWIEKGSGSASGGGVSDDVGQGFSPSLAIGPDGIPIIAWYEYLPDSDSEIYARRWQPFVLPIAEFSASPTSGLPPLIVEFTNLSTGDFNECLWDFGDGRTAATCGNPTHKFKEPGSYTISLTVKGPGGEDTMTKTDYITVHGPPTGDFSASPTSGLPPLTVQFTNLSTGNFNECLWDFGDGRTAATCGNPTHKFKEPGNYTISLTVKGPAGEDTMIKTDYITVHGPPTADFDASPTSGVPPLTVNFTNLSTGEYDECLWDFGDGRTAAVCGNPTRVFKAPGNYTISLTVKGAGGEDTMTKTDYITVHGPPTADFSATPTSGLPPLTVQFTNLSTGNFNECLWDFGDGRTAATCGSPTHKFRQEGSYTISLTVKGPYGEDTKTIKRYIKVGLYQAFLPGVLLTK